MNDTLLTKRTQMVFHMLSCEDPQYPRMNFLLRFREDVKTHLLNDAHMQDTSEDSVKTIMTEAAQLFIRAHAEESQWREIVAGWFAADIYEALKGHLLKY